MSECEGSSTVSEVSSDNLILVQEVFGECMLNHLFLLQLVIEN